MAIGRCIVRDPTVFLFDEPLSNLDAKLRSRTRVEIKRLLRRFNITTIYVTHDQTEAQAMGDRIAVMRTGQIEQLGTYREIYDNPANMFVAGFVGAPPMNLIPGTAENGGVRVNGHLFDLKLDGLGTRDGDKVHLGVRPEHIDLLHTTADGTMPAEIEYVESHFQTQTRQVTLDVGGNQVVVKRPLRRGVAARYDGLRPGAGGAGIYLRPTKSSACSSAGPVRSAATHALRPDLRKLQAGGGGAGRRRGGWLLQTSYRRWFVPLKP